MALKVAPPVLTGTEGGLVFFSFLCNTLFDCTRRRLNELSQSPGNNQKHRLCLPKTDKRVCLPYIGDYRSVGVYAGALGDSMGRQWGTKSQ